MTRACRFERMTKARQDLAAPRALGKSSPLKHSPRGQCGGASELGGFFEIATNPDTDGRLFRMIETVRGYARESGALAPARIEALLGTVRSHDKTVLDGRD
jgi:hypothetical protein